MYFRVSHESLYRYDVPVRLAPHVVRLTPRPGTVRIVSQRLNVDPLPSQQNVETDAWGNSVTSLSFLGETRSLRVETALELETYTVPALNGPLAPLPHYVDGAGGFVHSEVRAFAEQLSAEAGHDPVAFLDHLSGTLFSRMHRHIRTSGDARAAHETLALGAGACRDLTVLFLAACSALGLSGRFVSGYQAQADTPDGQHHLHAWAEVLLPTLGYRGWDPMHGVRVGDGHVALCAAPSQAATMPIEGGFYFNGAVVNSTLDYSLRMATSAGGF
jgi:transglutaminase-like putative cysteine protease